MDFSSPNSMDQTEVMGETTSSNAGASDVQCQATTRIMEEEVIFIEEQLAEQEKRIVQMEERHRAEMAERDHASLAAIKAEITAAVQLEVNKLVDLQFDELSRKRERNYIILAEQIRLDFLIAQISQQKEYMIEHKIAFERQQSARRRAVIRASRKLRLGTLNRAQKRSRYRRRLRSGQR